jgi:hypothetical protein
MRNLIILILMFTFLPTAAQAGRGMTQSERKEFVEAVKQASKKHNVDPVIPLAVAHVESSYRGAEFRIGLVGSEKSGGPYYAPFNIHYSYKTERGWPVDTLKGNVEAGVRCFRNMGVEQAMRRLRKYNTTCNSGYLKSVRAAILKYRKELS